MATSIWAENEVKNMTLKDKRRQDRVKQLLEILADNPTASIAQACKGSHAKTKAAYRFIGTTSINEQDILQGHYKATVERIIKSEDTALFLSDGMDVSLNNLTSTTGLGPIGNSIKSLGIKTHNTLAISPEGRCFGLIDQKYWARDKSEYGKKIFRSKRPTKNKESNAWIESICRIEERLPLNIDYIYIADGGADMYDFITVKRRLNSELLIHQAQNRNTTDGKLYDLLDKKTVLGYIVKKLKRTPNSPEREVKLEVRAASVELKSPDKTKAAHRSTTNIYSLVAKEIDADKSGSKEIVWRLLTTIKIDSISDAEKIIELYAKRWLVERFHYILKEGSRIEKLQMESVDNIKRAIALYSITSWRIMQITYIGRISPDISSEAILARDEWEALWCHHHKKPCPPASPPSVGEAISMIAKIGGFLGRKNDGEPGAKVLWRGIAALEHIVSTYLIFRR